MKKQEYTVTEPKELLEFLIEKMPDSSRTRVKELLAHNVYVDGRRTSQFNYPLQRGMKVSIEKASFQDRLRPRDLDIVYEDQHLMVDNEDVTLFDQVIYVNEAVIIRPCIISCLTRKAFFIEDDEFLKWNVEAA